MTSWRDTTSEQAQADLDALLSNSLELVEEALNDDEMFVPFGAAVDAAGEVTVMVTEDADDADDALAGLLRTANDLTADHRAFAFVAEIEVEDADEEFVVRVELEHQEGVAIAVTAGYDRSKLRRKVTQKRLVASHGVAHVFTG